MKLRYSELSAEQQEAHREAVRKWRRENPEKVRAAELLHNEKRRARYSADPEYREKILTNKVWKDTMRVQQKRRRDEDRAAVFDHYGRICSCCGEKIELFLTIDHIDSDGAEHRRQINPQHRGRNTSSSQVYRWLIKNGFPENFRTLCQNCNSGRYRNGGICPHESERKANSATLSAGAQESQRAS